MTPRSPSYRWHRMLHALRRRRWRSRIDRMYEQLVASWDQPAFRERFRPYWDPFPGTGPAKFLHVDVWLREAIFRYLLIDEGLGGQGERAGRGGAPRGAARGAATGRRVLDIGAGTGYFLLACRQQGDDVLGLDLPGEPIYDACFDFFDLPRIPHRIEPHRPLPDLGRPLDLVTAFMTCFNYYPDGRPWEADAWSSLLGDLHGRIRGGGRLVIKFNLEPESQRYYSPQVRRALQGAEGFHARLFFDYAVLTAR